MSLPNLSALDRAKKDFKWVVNLGNVDYVKSPFTQLNTFTDFRAAVMNPGDNNPTWSGNFYLRFPKTRKEKQLMEVTCRIPNDIGWDGSILGAIQERAEEYGKFDVSPKTTGEELATVHQQIVKMQRDDVYSLLEECKLRNIVVKEEVLALGFLRHNGGYDSLQFIMESIPDDTPWTGDKSFGDEWRANLGRVIVMEAAKEWIERNIDKRTTQLSED